MILDIPQHGRIQAGIQYYMLQVNKSNDQEVASDGDEDYASATSLVMTMAATIIGQNPQNHHMRCVPSGWAAL